MEWECLARGKEEGRKNAGMEEITLDRVTETVDRVLAGAAGPTLGGGS
jgi:hypothetical protein